MTKILTDRDKYLIQNGQEIKTLKPQTRAKFYHDLREKSRVALADLTLVAKHAPEKQMRQIFDAENLRPFLKTLLGFEGDKPDERRRRILTLWSIILSDVANDSYAGKLAGRQISQFFFASHRRYAVELINAAIWQAEV